MVMVIMMIVMIVMVMARRRLTGFSRSAKPLPTKPVVERRLIGTAQRRYFKMYLMYSQLKNIILICCAHSKQINVLVEFFPPK